MPATFTQLRYHIVFATKYRERTISPEIQEQLYRFLGGVLLRLPGSCLEIGGMPDHVHILASLSPTVPVSRALKELKGRSSRWINETFTPPKRFEWQSGYSAFTVSESQTLRVREYIRRQEEHHRRIPFDDEMKALLDRHGLAPDSAITPEG